MAYARAGGKDNDTVLTYDIEPEGTVKDTLMGDDYKYRDHFTLKATPKTVWMPESTLWHKTKTPEQAIDDLIKVASDQDVTVLRAYARDGNGWFAITGVKHGTRP